MRTAGRYLPSVARAAGSGLARTAARPHLLLAFLIPNLLISWVVAAPVRSIATGELDHTLYGEAMAQGASWRWFDTVERKHAAAVGDLSVVATLLGDEGAGVEELRQLSGSLKAALIAGLFFFWLNSLLHAGFLASLYPDRRPGFVAAVGRFALPTSAFAVLALASYLLVYALCYRLPGRWLGDLRQAVDSEWAALALTWGRLALTLAGLLAVKVLFDLSRVALVDRDHWNWPWAGILALREMWQRGGRYLLVYLLLGLGAPALVGLWWTSAGRFVPTGWLGLGLAFLLQQLFLAARIGLRLAHLAAAQTLYAGARSLPTEPPFKVEVPGRE